jgi:hypothetical protein
MDISPTRQRLATNNSYLAIVDPGLNDDAASLSPNFDEDKVTAYLVLKHDTGTVRDRGLFVRGKVVANVTMMAATQVITSPFRQSLENAMKYQLFQYSEEERSCSFWLQFEYFATFWIERSLSDKKQETPDKDDPRLFPEMLFACTSHTVTQRDMQTRLIQCGAIDLIHSYEKMQSLVKAMPSALTQYMDALIASLD